MFLALGHGTECLGSVDHDFLVISHDSHEFVFVDGFTDQVVNLELAAAFPKFRVVGSCQDHGGGTVDRIPLGQCLKHIEAAAIGQHHVEQ